MEKITLKQFEDIKSSKDLIIVKVDTPWCGYCKIMKGVVEPHLFPRFPEVKTYNVNADEEKLWEVESELTVKVVPTYFFYKDGKCIDTKTAFVPEVLFEKLINTYK